MSFLQLLRADVNNSECEKQPELSDDAIVVTLNFTLSLVLAIAALSFVALYMNRKQ